MLHFFSGGYCALPIPTHGRAGGERGRTRTTPGSLVGAHDALPTTKHTTQFFNTGGSTPHANAAGGGDLLLRIALARRHSAQNPLSRIPPPTRNIRPYPLSQRLPAAPTGHWIRTTQRASRIAAASSSQEAAPSASPRAEWKTQPNASEVRSRCTIHPDTILLTWGRPRAASSDSRLHDLKRGVAQTR